MDNNKIDTVKFAVFVGWLATRFNASWDEYDVRDMLKKLNDMLVTPVEPVNYMTKTAVAHEVTWLLNHMANGERINAIRSYRTLTGAGLKESKDTVENALSQKFAQKPMPLDTAITQFAADTYNKAYDADNDYDNN